MRQVAQRPRDGRLTVVDAPLPQLRPGWLLVDNRCSLISAGTERSKVELGEKSLLGKARARPDLARKVIDRARAEGVRSALGAARERLDTLAPIGYSSAGVAVSVGEGVEGLVPGYRVACAGGGWANHADVVAVPKNLVARIPDDVSFEAAAYTTVGAIALHGVRRAEAEVGERIGVVGLGLVGQLTVRILAAAGCEAIGIDVDARAVELARACGALAFSRDDQGLERSVMDATGGLGLDAVLVCASSPSPDPLDLAVRLARDRGRLVVVGDVPIETSRAALYDKELELRLSRSYGPGRYDRDYEERGRDLPPAHVRWTEQRNLEAFLGLVATGRLDPTELTTHRFPIDDAPEAYALLSGGTEDGERPFGIVLGYPEAREPAVLVPAPPPAHRTGAPGARLGVIGAGSFARATLLPALRDAGASFASVATEGGLSSADVAGRFGFERAASPAEVLEDDGVDAVVIATRHSSHAELAGAALRAGKHVFVEKPLALSRDELAEVEDAQRSGGGVLMVGFNRRFAPLTERLTVELASGPPAVLTARVNAGPLADEHWLNDPEAGGGRLLGEGCHFVDLLAHLAADRITSVHATAKAQPGRPLECSDEVVASFRFAGGGVATLAYSGGGDTRLPKERFEAFGGGLSAVLDDFRRLEFFRAGKRHVHRGRQDKGHRAQAEHFVRAVRGEVETPPAESYFASTRATLALVESLRTAVPVEP